MRAQGRWASGWSLALFTLVTVMAIGVQPAQGFAVAVDTTDLRDVAALATDIETLPVSVTTGEESGCTYDGPLRRHQSVDAASTQVVVRPIRESGPAIRPVQMPAAGVSYSYDSFLNFDATNTGGLADDVALVREHLSGLGPEVIGDPANQAMLSAIDDAIAAGRPLSPTELNFLRHELTEAELFAQGVPHTYGDMFNPFEARPPVNSHDLAWKLDGMKPHSNYYPWLLDQ